MKEQGKAVGQQADSFNKGFVALRAFDRMMSEWSVNNPDRRTILGGVSKACYHKWLSDGKANLSVDQLDRISYSLGIYKAVNIMFSHKENCIAFMKAKNKDYAFKGVSPIERMTQGRMSDLAAVRNYMDAMRGGR